MIDETTLFVLFLLGAIAWFWYSSIQAREIAVKGAKRRCESRNLLLLDQTVLLHKIRLRRDLSGQVRLKREYRFEFSDSGDDRFQGMITLHGKRITGSHIDVPNLH